jgi:hypothetical protein
VDPLEGLSGTALQNMTNEHWYQMENWDDIEAYNVPGLSAEKPPTLRVHTKEVRFSWDVRTAKEQGTPSRLRGKAYRFANRMESFTDYIDSLSNKQVGARTPEDDIRDRLRLLVFYHIHNDDRSVVEMGFWGSNRWQRPTPGDYIELSYAMPDLDDGLRNDYISTATNEGSHTAECSSSGVGAKLQMRQFV